MVDADQPSPPREGGWGIVVVIAAHLSLAIQSGLMRCGGVLYLSWKEDFGTNDQETAGIQSIFYSVPCFSCVVGGVLTQQFGCRVSGVIGGCLASLGCFCSHWVTDIVQFYVTALFIGIGSGICYNSAIVVVALYFRRRYKIAHAVAFSGLGTGIMVLPPIVQFLLESYGWRGAFLVLAGVEANSIALSALFRPNRSQQKLNQKPGFDERLAVTADIVSTRKEVSDDGDPNELEYLRREDVGLEIEASDEHCATPANRTGYLSTKPDASNPVLNLLKRLSVSLGLHVLVRSFRFAALCVIQTQYWVGLVGILVYLDPRAQSVGVAPSSAAILLSIYGVGSLLGRLGNGLILSWKLSAEHATAVFMVLSGATSLLFNVENYVVFAIASFLNGFAMGFNLSVVVILIRHFVGVGKFAVCIGISQVFAGVGSLIGPVFSGWILDTTDANYSTVFYVLGALSFLCAIQMLLLPLLRRVEPGIDIGPNDV